MSINILIFLSLVISVLAQSVCKTRNPCKNGGSCIDLDKPNLYGYRCDCGERFTGYNCDLSKSMPVNVPGKVPGVDNSPINTAILGLGVAGGANYRGGAPIGAPGNNIYGSQNRPIVPPVGAAGGNIYGAGAYGAGAAANRPIYVQDANPNYVQKQSKASSLMTILLLSILLPLLCCGLCIGGCIFFICKKNKNGENKGGVFDKLKSVRSMMPGSKKENVDANAEVMMPMYPTKTQAEV